MINYGRLLALAFFDDNTTATNIEIDYESSDLNRFLIIEIYAKMSKDFGKESSEVKNTISRGVHGPDWRKSKDQTISYNSRKIESRTNP